MKTLFHGGPVMVHDTHTRRRLSLKNWTPVIFSSNSNKSEPLSIIFGTKNNQFNLHKLHIIFHKYDKNRKPVRITIAVIAYTITMLLK